MNASYAEYRLLFKHPFHTAHGTRVGTDSVVLRVEHDGLVGYGEATVPPYRDDTVAMIIDVWRSIPWQEVQLSVDGVEKIVGRVGEKHPEAAAGMSMACYELLTKHTGTAILELLEVQRKSATTAPSMYTIAVSTADEVAQRVNEAPTCDALKLKLDGRDDIAKVQALLGNWSGPIFLDANQGWRSIEEAEVILKCVNGRGEVLGLEQPFHKNAAELHTELRERTNITIYADEAACHANDIDNVKDQYGGVNVKLMKCGGLRQAAQMMAKTRAADMKVMLGCMSESTCGTRAAMQLAGQVDLLDQDGPLLIMNDPFSIKHGELECLIPESGFRSLRSSNEC